VSPLPDLALALATFGLAHSPCRRGAAPARKRTPADLTQTFASSTSRCVNLPQYRPSALTLLPFPASPARDKTSDLGSSSPHNDGGVGLSHFAGLFDLVRSDAEDSEDDAAGRGAGAAVPTGAPVDPALACTRSGPARAPSQHGECEHQGGGGEGASKSPCAQAVHGPRGGAALTSGHAAHRGERGLVHAVAPTRAGARGRAPCGCRARPPPVHAHSRSGFCAGRARAQSPAPTKRPTIGCVYRRTLTSTRVRVVTGTFRVEGWKFPQPHMPHTELRVHPQHTAQVTQRAHHTQGFQTHRIHRPHLPHTPHGKSPNTRRTTHTTHRVSRLTGFTDRTCHIPHTANHRTPGKPHTAHSVPRLTLWTTGYTRPSASQTH
jgi:hypothetical protein